MRSELGVGEINFQYSTQVARTFVVLFCCFMQQCKLMEILLGVFLAAILCMCGLYAIIGGSGFLALHGADVGYIFGKAVGNIKPDACIPLVRTVETLIQVSGSDYIPLLGQVLHQMLEACFNSYRSQSAVRTVKHRVC